MTPPVVGPTTTSTSSSLKRSAMTRQTSEVAPVGAEVELFDVLVAMAARREDEVTLLERTRCAQRLEDAACYGHARAS